MVNHISMQMNHGLLAHNKFKLHWPSWFKAVVLKTINRETGSGVRISHAVRAPFNSAGWLTIGMDGNGSSPFDMFYVAWQVHR